MSVFANNDSFLEEVTDIESQAYEQGRKVGIAAAWAGDMLEIGCKGGFNKTYPMGLEVGFMEASERYTADGTLTGIATSIESATSDIPAGISAPEAMNRGAGDVGEEDSGGGPTQEGLQERKQRRKEQLLHKINMLPSFNSAAVDYEAEFHELRTLYRLNGSKMGKFLPVAGGSSAGSSGSSW